MGRTYIRISRIYGSLINARAYTRVLRLARTIADLSAEDNIQQHHLAEAFRYRRLFA